MTLDSKQLGPSKSHGTLHVAFDIAQRYQLASLHPLIQSCVKLAEHNELSIAVIGRFIRGAMKELVTECYRRIDELVKTVEVLVSTSSEDVTRIREDLKQLQLSRELIPISVDGK